MFNGLGKFTGEAKLQLKDNAVPTIHAPRRCPINIRNEVQTVIDDMESQGIIEKIPQGQPTEWLSSLVYARKANYGYVLILVI